MATSPEQIKRDQDRLRKVVLALRTQTRQPAVIDQFLACLNPVTSVEGRMPVTPQRVITLPNRMMVVTNMLAHAIIKWGRLARGEDAEANHELDQLERVVLIGFLKFGAFPKDRNSAIHVLRTVAEEKQIRLDRAAAKEKVEQAREARQMEKEIEQDATRGERMGLGDVEPQTVLDESARSEGEEADEAGGAAAGEEGDTE